MKERPMLFSGPMVRAIFAGTKTLTRRLVRTPSGVDPDHWMPQPAYGRPGLFEALHWPGDDAVTEPLTCPCGHAGDRLWIRETWAEIEPGFIYAATDADHNPGQRWRPSIHMPRRASRLSLEVVSVRVERLQEICEEDARAEGVTPLDSAPPGFLDYNHLDPDHTHRGAFAQLWDVINGERVAWKSNPWVWRVEFKRAEVL